MSWDDAGDTAAVRKDGIGQDPHQPDAGAAVNQPNPFRRHQAAQGLGLFDIPLLVSDVAGQVDADVLHAIGCAGLTPRSEASLFGDPVVDIIPTLQLGAGDLSLLDDQRSLSRSGINTNLGYALIPSFATSPTSCSARFNTFERRPHTWPSTAYGVALNLGDTGELPSIGRPTCTKRGDFALATVTYL